MWFRNKPQSPHSGRTPSYFQRILKYAEIFHFNDDNKIQTC